VGARVGHKVQGLQYPLVISNGMPQDSVVSPFIQLRYSSFTLFQSFYLSSNMANVNPEFWILAFFPFKVPSVMIRALWQNG
jgi:hypothetical protein